MESRRKRSRSQLLKWGCYVLALFVCAALQTTPGLFQLGQAKPLFLLANAGQIFYFISESLMVIVLRFTGEKLQIILNAGYAVIFFAAAIPAVLFGGLYGLAAAIFAVNIVRYLAVTLAGMFCRQQSQNNAEAQ